MALRDYLDWVYWGKKTRPLGVAPFPKKGALNLARVEKRDLSTSMPMLIHCFLQLDCGYSGIQCGRTHSDFAALTSGKWWIGIWNVSYNYSLSPQSCVWQAILSHQQKQSQDNVLVRPLLDVSSGESLPVRYGPRIPFVISQVCSHILEE